MTRGTTAVTEAFESVPDQNLEELSQLLVRAGELGLQGPVELYHRAAIVLRLTRSADHSPDTFQAGREDGLALRAGLEPGRLTFVAVSGFDETSLGWAVDQVVRGQAAPTSDALWPRGGDRISVDIDPSLRLPAPAEMQSWLDMAAEVAAAGPARLEVAATFESWATNDGLRASRGRTRAWAIVESRHPLAIAARCWEGLAPDGWAKLVDDRARPDGEPVPPPGGPLPILFSPEASAKLVHTIVRALHRSPECIGLPVGPGWRLEDDPLDPEALLGGTFDDAGFPTERRLLADGTTVVGVLDGPGSLRRPAFRDPPQSLPANLVVRAPATALPPRAGLVSSISIHPVEPGSWILELDGAALEAGRTGPPIANWFVRVDPGELVRRCLGSVGPARSSHRGVTTSALLFDDLSRS